MHPRPTVLCTVQDENLLLLLPDIIRDMAEFLQQCFQKYPTRRLGALALLAYRWCLSQAQDTQTLAADPSHLLSQDERPPLPPDISRDMAEFLQQCFQKDPTRRPGALALLAHRWVRENRRTLGTSWSRAQGQKARGVRTDAHKSVAATVEYMLQVCWLSHIPGWAVNVRSQACLQTCLLWVPATCSLWPDLLASAAAAKCMQVLCRPAQSRPCCSPTQTSTAKRLIHGRRAC